jgi:hypothetical protein
MVSMYTHELSFLLWPLSGIPVGAILLRVLLILGLGALFGTAVGGVQSLLLRERANQTASLVGLSALAGAASGLAGPLVTLLAGSLLFRLLPPALAAVITAFLNVAATGAVFGAISGAAWSQIMQFPSAGSGPGSGGGSVSGFTPLRLPR